MSLTQNRHALKVKVVDSDEKYQNKNAIKVKIEGGGGGTVTVDDALSKTSENPVQNKVITNKVEDIETAVASKQNTLTAGTNITIENDVISATGGGGASDTIWIYANIDTLDDGPHAGQACYKLYRDKERRLPFLWRDYRALMSDGSSPAVWTYISAFSEDRYAVKFEVLPQNHGPWGYVFDDISETVNQSIFSITGSYSNVWLDEMSNSLTYTISGYVWDGAYDTSASYDSQVILYQPKQGSSSIVLS